MNGVRSKFTLLYEMLSLDVQVHLEDAGDALASEVVAELKALLRLIGDMLLRYRTVPHLLPKVIRLMARAINETELPEA